RGRLQADELPIGPNRHKVVGEARIRRIAALHADADLRLAVGGGGADRLGGKRDDQLVALRDALIERYRRADVPAVLALLRHREARRLAEPDGLVVKLRVGPG